MSDPNQDALLSGDFAETRTDDLNAPIGWRGLPEFTRVERDTRLVLSFDTPEERDELIKQLGLVLAKKTGQTWSAWWPPRERDDLASLRFDFDADEQGEEDPMRADLREGRDAAIGAAEEDDRSIGAIAQDEAGSIDTAEERARPWPEHLGHAIALEWGHDGTIVGARCSTCGIDLPPPDTAVDVGADPGAADAPETAATAVQANESEEDER